LEITIIGGGITGLAAAYIAAKSGKKVRVLEANASFGGLLSTFEIGGNRLEHYYHHFFTHDAEINWLIKDLGISEKLRYRKTRMGVYRKGAIYDFNTPVDLLKFKPISFFDKVKFGFSSLFLGKIANWEKFEGISALQWFYKYAGKSSTDSLWKPLLDIKFGPYANKVPLAWMVGRLRQRMNSRKNGDERLGYIDGSLQVLLNALLSKLKELNVELINNAKVTKVHIENNGISGIETTQGEYKGGEFLFTIPSNYLSKLLENQSPSLSKSLANIEYFGAVCTILELKKPLSNIYWLNIADENFPFGGVIEHTNFIDSTEYSGSHIVYLSRYFAHSEPIASMGEEEIKQLMIQPLNRIYPHFTESDIKKVYIFKTQTAATVCDLHFSKKVPNCKTEIKNLFICSMPHIYPDERSTNNSIRIAAEACRVMGIDASFVPANASLSGKLGFLKT
jgi:protoporphyrinogen oxidase